jgi:hypothetical protein
MGRGPLAADYWSRAMSLFPDGSVRDNRPDIVGAWRDEKLK